MEVRKGNDFYNQIEFLSFTSRFNRVAWFLLLQDNLATELKQKISKDTVDSGMNKFEKVGQALYKYSSEIEDDSFAVVLKTAKEVFDNAGQKHRAFRTNMLEKVQKPMKEWIEVTLITIFTFTFIVYGVESERLVFLKKKQLFYRQMQKM